MPSDEYETFALLFHSLTEKNSVAMRPSWTSFQFGLKYVLTVVLFFSKMHKLRADNTIILTQYGKATFGNFKN